jgi:2-dehydropantoate 2-reductase
MQNGINEERIASVAGWGKTVGCALSTISVNCFKPGHMQPLPAAGAATVTPCSRR